MALVGITVVITTIITLIIIVVDIANHNLKLRFHSLP